MLGPGVDPTRVAGHLPPGQTADVYEMSRGLLLHVPDGRVCRVEEAQHVDFEHGPPLVREALTHRREQHDARVVDQDVDTSELLDRPLNEVVGLLLISNIALNRDSLPAVAGHPLNELVEALLTASPGDDRGAFGRQRAHRSFSDAARGPSHDRDLTVQPVPHVHHLSMGRGPTTRVNCSMPNCGCYVPQLSGNLPGPSIALPSSPPMWRVT